MATAFNKIYKRFYSKITDDMYMELDPRDTEKLTQELLINAIDWFEFPRVNLNNYSVDDECFNITLTTEEINILATYMVVGWLDQQLATIELTRMKYSGSDFKFTSQAAHLGKLTALRQEYERIGFHLQRLYKRRKVDEKGAIRSTMSELMATSARGQAPETINFDNSGEGKWQDLEEGPKAAKAVATQSGWNLM